MVLVLVLAGCALPTRESRADCFFDARRPYGKGEACENAALSGKPDTQMRIARPG